MLFGGYQKYFREKFIHKNIFLPFRSVSDITDKIQSNNSHWMTNSQKLGTVKDY